MITEVYLYNWLDTFVRPFRAPNTAACYRRAIASLPASVMGCELSALDGMAIQAAINRQAAKHPRAAQLTYTTLHAALGKAVQLGYLQRHPMAACMKPIHQPRKAAVLSPAQLAAYINAARPEPSFPLLLLIATLGLRRSEALGVQWQCIDAAAGCIHITQQRIRVNHGYQLRPLKSKASRRVLPISPPLAAELTAVRADQRTRAFSGFVCDITPDALRLAHLRVLKRASLPAVTLHGLRHSVATAAAVAGCPMKILQGILGHSKYDLTANLYADHIATGDYAPYLGSIARCVLG